MLQLNQQGQSSLSRVGAGVVLPARPSQQRGVVLMVSLIILVVLTSMGISGMRTANLEEHFAGNLRDQNLAFEAAETALRFGEDWMAEQISKPAAVDSCGSPPCDIFMAAMLENGYFSHQTKDWWAANGRTTYTKSADYLDHVSNQPRFVVEESTFAPDSLGVGTGIPPGKQFYRVTAFGQGGSEYTHVVLQSTYAKRY